jgi:hypothetical protein
MHLAPMIHTGPTGLPADRARGIRYGTSALGGAVNVPHVPPVYTLMQ